jgi:4-amino-4-deoxy-L-arabinose transferase-like glycosyltransferase
MFRPPASEARAPEIPARVAVRADTEKDWWQTGPKPRNLALTLVGLALLLLGLTLGAPLSRDEHMYVAAGVLVRRAQLYRDFAYLQGPYLPWLYSAVFAVTGQHLLLAARLTSLVATAITLALTWRVGLWISGSRRAAWLALVLVGTHHLLLFASPYARNHPVALACSLAAFAAAWRGLAAGRGWSYWWATAGALAAVAAGVRLMHLPLAAALLLTCVFAPRAAGTRNRLLKACVPFALGFTVAAIPAAVSAARAGAQLFVFNNVGYHRANEYWYAAHHGPNATLGAKLLYAGTFAIKGSGAALVVALLVAWAVSRSRQREDRTGPDLRPGTSLLISLSIIAAVLAALLPTPPQRDYLIMFVPFAALGFCALLRRPPGVYAQHARVARWPRTVLVALVSLSAVAGVATSMRHLRHLVAVENWTPLTTHSIGEQITRSLPAGSGTPRVATLAPLFPLEGGLSIYPELATGWFLYRVAPYLTDASRELPLGYVIGPAQLPGLLESHSPSAVLAGFGGQLENALTEFAERRGYEPHDLVPRGELFARPAGGP